MKTIACYHIKGGVGKTSTAADLVVVPLIPTTLSLRTFDQLTDFVADLDGRRPPVLAFFSMVDRRTSLHRQIVADLPTQRPGISPVSVPAAAIVEQMAVHRAPVVDYAPRRPVVRQYQALWREVCAAADAARATDWSPNPPTVI